MKANSRIRLEIRVVRNDDPISDLKSFQDLDLIDRATSKPDAYPFDELVIGGLLEDHHNGIALSEGRASHEQRILEIANSNLARDARIQPGVPRHLADQLHVHLNGTVGH